ncbi:hypothetical protein CROQUDRAFT_206819 [Cronartium quercuum f. sp. fusiforme G11]|uniref:Uncharacterized protein n=1 Tax=Cronartium quercuum f. sp. fusiforme G11 TaxID=708437 RepID=A0A9P6NFW2_9BASI|nr:hypothetical protein CROQUDRAFT_206819 [Cronartium quercuum f. sp. fusiforme G11]
MDGFSDPFVGDPDLTLTEKQTLSQEDWLLQVLSEVSPVSDTAYAQPFSGLDNLLPQSGLKPIPETSSLSASSELSSLQDAPPALSTRSATSKRTSTSSSTSLRKLKKSSHHDPDEPVEVIPRRFFPPTGTRKQHRSGFRQVPDPNGIVKKGRPSKKAYKEGGVGIDMYVHKKILLPANKDEVPEMPKSKSKPRLKSTSKSESSIAVDNSENGARSGSSVVYQAPAPIELATLPHPAAPQFNNNFNLAQPLMPGRNQGMTGTEYSSWNAPNFNWSLSQPPQAADPIIPPGAGYGQQSSYLSVPFNSSYASTYSSPGFDPLALGPIQPDLASYSLQNGQISHSNQALVRLTMELSHFLPKPLPLALLGQVWG